MIVWQKAHQLVLEIYKLTEAFPNLEKFSLVNQLRRAIVSVASNIVEGFYRRSVKERRHFYIIAMSSLEEAKYQILIAKDLKYISEEEYCYIYNLADEVGKLIRGWIKVQR